MPYRHLDPDLRVEALRLLATHALSQRAVARQLGVHHTTIAWWASGGGTGRASRATVTAADKQRARLSPWERNAERPYWAYLFGMYLGDGYIDPTGRLRIFCDKKYPGIIDEVDRALRRVGVDRPWHVLSEGCCQLMCGDYGWADHLPTGSGPKHAYALRLQTWHREAISSCPHLVLRGLIQSDGCRFVNRISRTSGGHYEYPSYDFSNVSQDVHAIFEECARRVGISHTTHRRGRVRRIARRPDVALLDLWIGPKR